MSVAMEYNTPSLGIKVILMTIKVIYLGGRDGQILVRIRFY